MLSIYCVLQEYIKIMIVVIEERGYLMSSVRWSGILRNLQFGQNAEIPLEKHACPVCKL